MIVRFLRSSRFWLVFAVAGVVFGLLLLWESGAFAGAIYSLPRAAPLTTSETLFAVAIVLLLAFNSGLFAWQQKEGTCPIGTRRATSAAGALGAITLVCPVCLLIPVSILGTGLTLSLLAPYLPLLRFLSLVLLVVSAVKLWPHEPRKRR